MAYVAITQNLIKDTDRNIHKMCITEKAQVPPAPAEMVVPDHDVGALTLVWGDFLYLKDIVPDSWKKEVSVINVRVDKTAAFSVRATRKFSVPNIDSNGYDSATAHLDGDHEFAQTIAAQHVANQKLFDSIDKKWDEIRQNVEKFLKSARSLNEALKVWPALALYLAPSYLDRVNESAKRHKPESKAAEVLASFASDEATAAAVAVKLTV